MAMASLLLSFSLGDITTDPPPISNSNNLGAPVLQEAFLRRPFALTGADTSSSAPSLIRHGGHFCTDKSISARIGRKAGRHRRCDRTINRDPLVVWGYVVLTQRYTRITIVTSL